MLYGSESDTAALRKLMPCRRNHYSAVQTSPGKHGASQTLGSDERGEGGHVARQRYGNCHCGGQRGKGALTLVCVILQKLGWGRVKMVGRQRELDRAVNPKLQRSTTANRPTNSLCGIEIVRRVQPLRRRHRQRERGQYSRGGQNLLPDSGAGERVKRGEWRERRKTDRFVKVELERVARS